MKKFTPSRLPVPFFLLVIFPFCSISQTTTTYTTTGNTDWVVPSGVCTVTVQVWGGGGAGGGASATDCNGGGGGGGAYCTYVETVTPGETIRITVGAGGTGVSSGTGGAGGLSQVQHLTGAVVFCKAVGGSGGTKGANSSSAGAGGAGGLKANNIPANTGFSGGNGGASNPSTGSSDQSGGGGGGAGSTGNGGNGAILTAGAAGAGGGGSGGAGVSTTTNGGSTGAAGNTIGGGGAGSTVFNTGTRAGGNGARGEVRVAYSSGCCPYPSAPSGITGNSAPCTGATETYTTSSSGATGFNWEIPAGWSVVSGANTNSITVVVGVGGGAVAVAPTNTCGTLSQTTLGITLCSVTAADMTYTTPGTYTWVVPDCVSSVYVQTWGGGGGGGGIAAEGISCSICSYVEACSAAGGGGGGGYTSRSYAVNTGDTYTIVVGAGGTAGPASNSSTSTARDGGVGGNSTFSGPATASLGTLTGLGGGAGQGARTLHTGSTPDHQGNNGTGGTGSSGSNGTATKTGGNGAVGMHSASCWDLSGGGGGGAGSTSNGSNATTLVCYGGVGGGTGGTSDGGAGASGNADNGISTQSFSGISGTSIGGGGGGALDHSRNWLNSWITQAGGAGARGEVRLTYGSCLTLPILLASFEGKCFGTGKEITWVTLSEQNNKNFTLEHSKNGLDFEPIKIVPGKGNSSSVQTYAVNVSDGSEYKYYKLTQTDFNGVTKTYNAISFDCNSNVSDFLLYPNPAQDHLSISFSKNIEGAKTVIIKDIIGRVIINEAIDSEEEHEIHLNIENLAAGNYIAELWSADFSKKIGMGRLVKK